MNILGPKGIGILYKSWNDEIQFIPTGGGAPGIFSEHPTAAT
jgi:hypothetical protein